MQFDRGFQCVFQARRMVLHARDVLHQVVDAHHHHVAPRQHVVHAGGGFFVEVFIAQFLQGIELLFAQIIELMQGQPFVEQLSPIVEAVVALQKQLLPQINAAGQWRTQLQIFIDQCIDDAQHQIQR